MQKAQINVFQYAGLDPEGGWVGGWGGGGGGGGGSTPPPPPPFDLIDCDSNPGVFFLLFTCDPVGEVKCFKTKPHPRPHVGVARSTENPGSCPIDWAEVVYNGKMPAGDRL